MMDLAFSGSLVLALIAGALALYFFLFPRPQECPKCGRKLRVIGISREHYIFGCPKCSKIVYDLKDPRRYL